MDIKDLCTDLDNSISRPLHILFKTKFESERMALQENIKASVRGYLGNQELSNAGTVFDACQVNSVDIIPGFLKFTYKFLENMSNISDLNNSEVHKIAFPGFSHRYFESLVHQSLLLVYTILSFYLK